MFDVSTARSFRSAVKQGRDEGLSVKAAIEFGEELGLSPEKVQELIGALLGFGKLRRKSRPGGVYLLDAEFDSAAIQH